DAFGAAALVRFDIDSALGRGAAGVAEFAIDHAHVARRGDAQALAAVAVADHACKGHVAARQPAFGLPCPGGTDSHAVAPAARDTDIAHRDPLGAVERDAMAPFAGMAQVGVAIALDAATRYLHIAHPGCVQHE